MKLSKKDKQELRKSVEVLLNASPDNKKIQLSNETLDQLLFDTYVIDEKKGIKMKIPVWSGDFLRKLDLSRVSFEDVSWAIQWDIMTDRDIYFDEEFGKLLYEKLSKLEFSLLKDDYYVCYANTNARIDFSKSFDAKYNRYHNGHKIIEIAFCDFSNVDLSDSLNLLQFEISPYLSNFSNTNIKYNNICNPLLTNFSNNNFSELEIDVVEILEDEGENDYSNTGVNLVLDPGKFQLLLGQETKNSRRDYYIKLLKESMEKYWGGCYLNGKLIQPTDEKKQTVEQILEEYEQYKNQIFTNILGSIEEQMDSSGPTK